MNNRITVLTYNVHKCRGMDARVNPARIVNVLREIDADVIALQEVLGSHEDAGQDQAKFIAQELGFDVHFGENRRLNGGAYGNLLLSRFPLRAVRNHNISTEGREERGCLRADLDLGGTTLHVFNVHLGTGFFERRQQAGKLVSPEILHDPELRGARIVLGDFNEWTRGKTSQMLGQNFEKVDVQTHLGRSRTYPGLFPLLHLDHIYFDPALKMRRLSLHKSRAALLASDHLPLIAEFELEPSSAAPPNPAEAYELARQ
ncbi:MAG TPA: endonuclease/exonuclease/phosphatase family protein [Acidobacteriaceae bacterium]|nr:endonuclease/exonuclease/phosphatase family protein [Acidobacteriaceae bacterium]